MNEFKNIDPILLEPYYRGAMVHYWEVLCRLYENSSTDTKKELFLFLLEKMITDGKLRIDHPTQPGWWQANPKEIANYFRKKWPEKIATPENDHSPEIWNYFYSMPFPIWRDEGGSWRASI